MANVREDQRKVSVREEMEARTKRFAIRVIKYVDGFERMRSAEVVSYQLVKAATSVGANYREAGRASSSNDFIHKLAIVEKEAAETQYWLEICSEAGIGQRETAVELLRECSELLAIMTASGRKAKSNRGLVSEDEPLTGCE
jgi:four helix bundle protein